MGPIDLACFDGHRAVEENLPARESPLTKMLPEQIKNFLATADSESRCHDVSVVLICLPNNLTTFFDYVFPETMESIAVRVLHQNHICRIEAKKIEQDRRAVLTGIAAENGVLCHSILSARHIETAGA